MLPKDMPSLAQIRANRLNAQKSSGPRSQAGKAASSRNAVTHGLTGKKHILTGEDTAEFDALLQDFKARFQPVGPAEENLVQLIAADQWRLGRAIPWEAGILVRCLEIVDDADFRAIEGLANHRANHASHPDEFPPPPDPPDPDHRLSRAFAEDARHKNLLGKLNRYQAAVQRSIDRSLRQLKIYQEARRSAEAAAEAAAKAAKTAPAAAKDAAKAPAPAPETSRPTTPQPPSTPVETESCKTNPIPGQPPLPAPPPPPVPGETDAV